MLLSIICHSYLLLRKYMIAEHNERWQIPLDICHWPFLMFVFKRHLQPNVKTYQLLLAMQQIYATCNLSFSCFANMTPAIKIYMTYYDVICHLSWSCRMVYVSHLLLQTWQSQSTQTLLTTWHLSFINVFCNMPFLSLSSVATTALANNDKIINKHSQKKKSQCSATCNCPLLCLANVTHNESW